MATEVTAPSADTSLLACVPDAIELCEPCNVHWCDGSSEEYASLCGVLVEAGTFERRRPYAGSSSGSARSAGRTSDAPTAAERQPTMTASDTHVGMCQTSLSSIFAPTKARMTAKP
jgi:phosphoenolpyruvate carboxykinase (GTP)